MLCRISVEQQSKPRQDPKKTELGLSPSMMRSTKKIPGLRLHSQIK